ncbi:MAG: hypothetical protein KKF46_04285 [Nanoarchaeota archaeon]|nr:hypothetical protein [Nanoarchaeota archaeon]MBU1321554.1 hypothetical protein [Nanoarchaeota archaeon]MBU1597088.1 hypothetical protein [Nanoarchaeota archaeon]MBU2441869.1 hypothetical protein [Nanoarchaeota archaeon]
MKKILSVLVLVMFLLSALSFAIAEDDNTDAEDVEVEFELDNAPIVAGPLVTNIKAKVKAKTAAKCFEELTEEYPSAVPAKIRAACALAFRATNKPMVVQQVKENAPEDAGPRAVALRIAHRLSDIQSNRADNIMNSLPSKAEVLQKLDRARLKECLEEDEEACKERLMNMVKKTVKVKDLLRVREIAEDKLQKAKQAFEKAKENYDKAKQFQNRVRNEFNGLKGELQECRDSGEDCSDLESQILEKAKENLLGIADRLIQHLEKIKSRLESEDNVEAVEASEAIAEIDALIAELEDAKVDVEAATNKEELDVAAKTIRDIWNDIKGKAAHHAERVIWGSVKGIFKKSELLEDRLDKVLERLEEKGIDTSDLEDLLDQFSGYIDDARSKMAEADDLFAEAKDLRSQDDTEGAKEALEQAKALTREAHQSLKDAHRVLMQIVKEINQNGESFDPEEIDDEEEVEVVVEVEDE